MGSHSGSINSIDRLKNAVTSSMDNPERRKGYKVGVTAFFLVAQMAGAGFLALPSALAATGWIGIPLMVIFCFTIGFSGTRLGNCWVILEERWPEYKKAARQPYMEIAFRSFGIWGRRLILVCVLITLIGSGIVFLVLIAQFIQALAPNVSMCLLLTIVSVGYIPFTWLGTPKDFWQGSVLAVVATVIACVIIVVELAIDKGTVYIPSDPTYPSPTFQSFSLGFGMILFAFGGASAFPTIQNDMEDRSQFWKGVVIAFGVLLVLYMPVALSGYILLGGNVPDNILLYRGENLNFTLKFAIGMEIINLIVTFLILFNPIGQTIEEILNVPAKFCWQRCAVRSSVIIFQLIIGMAIPDFGLILNLVGGSTITICSFVFPCLMYMKLVGDKSNKEWPERTIPKWQRFLMYEIVIIGTIGGICSTGSAINGIIHSSFSTSCFVEYTLPSSS